MKKSVISIISVLIGLTTGAGAVKKFSNKDIEKEKNMSEKHFGLFLLMNQWVKIKQEGKSLAHYLEKQGYKKVAVYGMSYAGETLVDELKDSCIQVTYAIDKNAGTVYENVNIVSPEEGLENVDAIIVTAITFYEEVKENLTKKISVPILSLEDLLYEI